MAKNEIAKEFLRCVTYEIEQSLDKIIPLQTEVPETQLYQAMRYSLFAGGKRLRPALFLAVLEMFGRDRQMFLPFASALEMIHTYSLIHDDLPAMDNDDLRRGKPTCHKMYGEAMAILAGDALLTQSFALMLQPLPGVTPARQLAAVHEVAWQAGIGGMVAGQAAEMTSDSRMIGCELLDYIGRGKTGALFAAAAVSAAELSGAAPEEIAALRIYAMQLGLAFQIVDDVLDVTGDQHKLGKPVGSDKKNNKQTYAELLGCEAAMATARQTADQARNALKVFSERSTLLGEFIDLCVERIL